MVTQLRFLTVSFLLFLSISAFAQPQGPALPKEGKTYEVFNNSARAYLSIKDKKIVTSSSAGDYGKWQFIALGNNAFHIVNKKTNQFLTAPTSNPETSALEMLDKATAYSKWYIKKGTGLNSRYIFISNAQNNLYITDSGRADINITHRKLNDGGKMFSWRFVAK